VATDGHLDQPTPLPVLDINDPEAIAEFVINHCQLKIKQPIISI